MVATKKVTYTSSVSAKGQITLPIELRRALNIEPHDIVTIELDGQHLNVEPATARLLSGFGVVPVPDRDRDWKTIERDAFDDVAEQTMRRAE